ncbi:MAG: Periplasmic serine endoprotease DegP, partial [Alphaproteobacteria bacterium MarineAlpha4_Bin2]
MALKISSSLSSKWSYMAKLLFVLPVVVPLTWTLSDAAARSVPNGFADLAERLLPSVVTIETSQKAADAHGHGPQFDFPPGSPFREFFEEFNKRRRDAPRRGAAVGSGFIISADGYVVTNNHVIENAESVEVVLNDDRRLKGKVIGKDPKTDLALIKIEPKDDLKPVEWGNSKTARIGDWVVAIGNPLGLGGTVTAGIISARGRNLRSGPYDDFIQTDAPINRGNSGGPLFDIEGRVIGVNTAILSPSGGSIGIGFAIPESLAQGVIGQLKEFGTTKRGWLGVQIQSVTDEIAESLGLGEAEGALVAGVVEDSPAANAGFKTGDVILSFNNVDVPRSRNLPRIVADTGVGKEVDVVVWREGNERTLRVTLGELEKVDVASFRPTRKSENKSGSTETIKELGLKLAPFDKTLAKQFELDEESEGVVIVDVERDSSAREKGLQPGTLVVEVNQEKVTLPAEIAAKIEEARAAGRRSVL